MKHHYVIYLINAAATKQLSSSPKLQELAVRVSVVIKVC